MFDGVFNPIMEGGDSGVDAWEPWPSAAVSGRDHAGQNPLVVIPANHRAAGVILKTSMNCTKSMKFEIVY